MTLETNITSAIMNLDIPFFQGNKYLEALIIFIFFYVASQLIIYVSEKILLKLTAKTKTVIDDQLVSRINKPISIILILFGLRIAFKSLDFIDSIDIMAGKIFYSLITLIFVYMVIVTIDILIDNWGKNFAMKTHSRVDYQLLEIFHKISTILLSIIGLLLILKIWGFEIGPLLASLGIAGIAVAFALQNTLGNIFGGISLILDKSIRVGEFIQLDADTQGEVIDVGLRSTKIKSTNNEIIIIPNGKLADSKIINLALPDPKIRLAVDFSVEYGSDVDRVKEIVLNEIKKNQRFLKDPPPSISFGKMGDFALHFTVFFWVGNYQERLEEKDKAVTAIYNVLNKHNIGIPFPTRTVFMVNKNKDERVKK